MWQSCVKEVHELESVMQAQGLAKPSFAGDRFDRCHASSLLSNRVVSRACHGTVSSRPAAIKAGEFISYSPTPHTYLLTSGECVLN